MKTISWDSDDNDDIFQISHIQIVWKWFPQDDCDGDDDNNDDDDG